MTVTAKTIPAFASERNRARLSIGSLWVAALLAILAFLVLYPIAMLLIGALSSEGPLSPDFSWTSLSFRHFVEVFSRASVRTALVNSIVICSAATAFALLLGLLFAWLTERTDTPAKGVIAAIGLMPLFVPSLVAAIAWSLLGSPRTGLLNVVLAAVNAPFRVNLYSTGGIIFVLAVYYAPYVYLFAAAALRNMDASLEEAAAIAGVGPLRTFLTITLPVIAPAIASAALMSLVIMLGIWGVPAVLGTPARISTLTTHLYSLLTRNPPDYSAAAAASFVLIGFTGIAVLIQRRYLASRSSVTITGKSMRPRLVALGPWRYVSLAFGILYLLVAVVLPLLALVLIATRRFIFVTSVQNMVDPSLFGWGNFIRLFEDQQTLPSIKNSLIVGAATAVVGTALCFALGYTIQRTRLKGIAVLDVVASLPVAIPGLVIGVAYLWAWIAAPIGLYGTLAILVLAGLARYLPDALKSLSGTLGQTHRELEEASWICGGGLLQTIGRVVAPLALPGIGAAATLFFVLSIREYGATIFLYNNRTVLMPVLLIQFMESSNMGVVAAFSLVQVAVLFLIVGLGNAIGHMARRRQSA